MINEETQKVVELLSKAELKADEILTDRAQLVELERRKNGNREALRSMTKSNNNKEWVCVGKLFIRLPQPTVKSILESDQETIAKAMENLRDGLKPKVAKLYELEGKAQLAERFSLKPLSRSDAELFDTKVPK